MLKKKLKTQARELGLKNNLYYFRIMDIYKLLKSLSESEKIELRDFLNKYIPAREVATDYFSVRMKEAEAKRNALASRETGIIPIEDYVKVITLPVLLTNTLLRASKYGDFYYMDDITKKGFFKLYCGGKKSWEYLLDSVNNKLQGTIYEPYQEALKKHFAQFREIKVK